MPISPEELGQLRELFAGEQSAAKTERENNLRKGILAGGPHVRLRLLIKLSGEVEKIFGLDKGALLQRSSETTRQSPK